MKKNNKIFLLLLAGGIFFFISTVKSVYAVEISVGASYTDFELSGKAKYKGTKIDIEKDLAVGGNKSAGGILRIDSERHHLTLEFTSVEFGGSKSISEEFKFNDKTYTVNAQIDSKLEYDILEIQCHYDLLDLENEMLGFSLAPLFKVAVYDAALKIKSSTLGYDETYSEILPLPTVGLLTQLNFTKYLNFSAQVNGIEYEGNSYFEYRALLEIKPMEGFSIGVGHKGVNMDYSDGDDLLDMDIEGLFAQAVLSYKF